ncbi:PA14 domain-containing protein [Streptomyces sp. NPDC050504]|uniref:PA14 domain-containing protein n=1 Tax=Streptomyces sp. NPDC050504 TaxID=3365618 RepID=UPI0037A4BC64
MAHSRRLRAPVATAASLAVSFTLLGAGGPAASQDTGKPDASRVALLPAAAGDAVRAAWPDGDFDRTPAATAGHAAALRGTALGGPADGAVLTGVRPVLSVARQQGARAYEFVLGTGESPRTGQVTSSGWVRTPHWRVPAGLLRSGAQYRWTVRVKTLSGTVGADAPARSFSVNQRLGAQAPGGPVPTDALGPVTVNLANGNVTASVSTPTVQRGTGPLGATFSYDSQAAASAAGLTGAYYAGDSATGIGAGEKPAARRTDARVDFRWGAQAPYPDAAPEAAFRARWTGKLTVPGTGRYRLGGTYDGGMRILLDGKPVLDDWQRPAATGERAAYGTEVTLRAGHAYDIRIDYRRRADGGQAGLWVSGDGRSAPVPASWLRPSGAVLPPGWTVTPDATAPEAASAANRASGPTAPGAPTAAGSAGAAEATGAAGATGVAGASPAAAFAARSADAAKAAQGARQARQGNRDNKKNKGAAGVAGATEVAALVAAAEDEGLRFFYGGSAECADDTAPAGYVCAVRVPGAGTTRLVYRAGKLVRFVNPGRETTDFGFSADHRLTAVRPPLVMDWIAVAPAARDTEAAQYKIAYGSGATPVARRVSAPDPEGVQRLVERRPERTYAFAPGSAEIRVAGVTTAQGWTRKVGLDAAGRTVSDTDGTRRTTRYTWTAADQPASTTDPAGRTSTTVHNEGGMPVGTYGPGPARCFGTDLRPLSPAPEGCGRIPAQTTEYAPDGVTTVRADSDGVPAQTNQTLLNELGLPAAQVADPKGLALRTGVEFNEAFMPAAKINPSGTRQTFDYYGPTESVDNPCTPQKDPLPQFGLPSAITLPASADGTARAEKFVSNERGLPAAVNFGGADWTCVTYDERGQISTMSMPGNANLPAWKVSYDTSFGGDPLVTKAVQHDHSLLMTVDLLGRTVGYTDGHGTVTELVLDRAGRQVQERVTPPSGADAAQVKETRYDAAGRTLSVDLGGKRLAETGYDAGGALERVRYGNGTQLSVGRDEAGRVVAKNWTLADGGKLPATVRRSQSGTVVDESVAGKEGRADGPDFEYDAAGRLVRAWIAGHEYSRDFTAQAPADCPSGSRANAGLNGNVVRATDRTATSTVTTGYCYDDADRLLATTGAHPLTGPSYGLNGHLTGYRSGTTAVTQRQDAAERYLGGSVDGPDAADVTYTKDIADHLTARDATTPKGTSRLLYSHTSASDVYPDLVLGSDERVLARVVPLPGGVVLSLKGQTGTGRTTWSHPTVRGDVFLLTGETGRQLGDRYQYGLYGEALRADGTPDPDHVPDNLPGDYDYGWLGRYQSGTEHAGAQYSVVLDTRVLNPSFGRFSAPVSGGPFLNPYEYAAGDPVNHTSIDGYSLDVEKE